MGWPADSRDSAWTSRACCRQIANPMPVSFLNARVKVRRPIPATFANSSRSRPSAGFAMMARQTRIGGHADEIRGARHAVDLFEHEGYDPSFPAVDVVVRIESDHFEDQRP